MKYYKEINSKITMIGNSTLTQMKLYENGERRCNDPMSIISFELRTHTVLLLNSPQKAYIILKGGIDHYKWNPSLYLTRSMAHKDVGLRKEGLL